MQKQDIRHIENPFKKIFNIIKPEKDKLYELLFRQIDEFIKGSQLPTLTSITSVKSQSFVDVSAYNGVGGYTYTLIRLAIFFSGEKMMSEEMEENISKSKIIDDDILFSKLKNKNYYLDLAFKQYHLISEYYEKKSRSRKSLSFFMSETCNWLCGMHLGYLSKDPTLFNKNKAKLLECYDYYRGNQDKMMWELLYGVPGFLYVFLQLQKQYENHPDQRYRTNFSPITKALTVDIINSGIQAYQNASKTKIFPNEQKNELPDNFRLIYLFHNKQYLGGAHGLGGNINIILLSLQLNNFPIETLATYSRLISKSILFLLRHFINGNFSTSANSQQIKLAHFCHGSPGILSGLARYMNMFPEESIRLGIPSVLVKSLQFIWQFGVLKKGFGLCHGISGNGYIFISPAIHKALPDMKEQLIKKAYLFNLLNYEQDVMKEIRQYKFSDRMKVGVSDEPYSLMVGIAGDICFTMDVISGEGKFPGFDF